MLCTFRCGIIKLFYRLGQCGIFATGSVYLLSAA